jgi:hypothetical protein
MPASEGCCSASVFHNRDGIYAARTHHPHSPHFRIVTYRSKQSKKPHAGCPNPPGRVDMKYRLWPLAEMNGANVTLNGVLTFVPRFSGGSQAAVAPARRATQMSRNPMFPGRCEAKYNVSPSVEIEGANSAEPRWTPKTGH